MSKPNFLKKYGPKKGPKSWVTSLVWQKWLATVGGAGFLPVAPGTWGAAAGSLLLVPFLGQTGVAFWTILGAVSLFFCWLGAKAAHDLEADWGEDPSIFVLDETVGVWVAMIGFGVSWQNLLATFVLFRLFDILKPLGIRRLEVIKKGWGVMLDDVAAGVLANFAWRVVLFSMPDFPFFEL